MKNKLFIGCGVIIIIILSLWAYVEPPKDYTYEVDQVGFVEEGVIRQASYGLKVTVSEKDNCITVFDDKRIKDVFRIDSVSTDSYEGVYIIMYHTHHEFSKTKVFIGYKFTFATEKDPKERKLMVMLIDDYPDTVLKFKKKAYEPPRKS